MGSVDKVGCACSEAFVLERLRYFPRQLLTADDMRLEQEYFREKQRRHNRFLHGWGVVCGLLVQANPTVGPLALTICPGYALGPCGDEIYVPEPVPFDLTATTQQLVQPSCANPSLAVALESGLLSIVIRYTECPTRPVRTLPPGCGCDDSDCEFSRIRDGFEIRCVPKPDVQPTQETTLCEIHKDVPHKLPSFPSPPSSDWVELATITMKNAQASSTLVLNDQSIDNSVRRVVYSTRQIQEQLITSC